jgi:hypothetical protein
MSLKQSYIARNVTKHASHGLDVDIEIIILKICGHFSVLANRTEAEAIVWFC